MQYEPISRPPIRDPDVITRMAIAFDLFDTAVAMMHQNLRRKNPGASEEDIEAGVREWLQRRPGAEHGYGRSSRRFDS